MTFIKLFVLFILVTMMENRGIIYRTGKRSPAKSTTDWLTEGRKGEILYGSWRLSGVKMDQPIRIFPYEESDFEKEIEKPGELLISFFPDSTFTQIGKNGAYQAGRWAYDSLAVSVFLTIGRTTEEVPLAFDRAANGMRLMNFEFGPEQILSLIQEGTSISRSRDDPFHPANNQWRLKPGEPENREQLLQRLRNYILHTAYILKTTQIRQNNRVSLEFSEGIVRLYNVGVGIVKPDKIPPGWTNGFYSPDDALKAYHILEDYLLTEKLKIEKTGNWVRDDYNILIDIHKGLGE
ncbi:hypothetical protein [Dyadobacter sp. CY323]|uniref:hypothetical protein n=1 Tax=Dyadobacter sp. CY323 TaxID=2907302 RepID=UPI001F33E6DB|nr:hypothetical protein [Dyadobacter sp. CY323]MCE6987748.1 hypothetical protein [Dyadobacter sp. CY323]